MWRAGSYSAGVSTGRRLYSIKAAVRQGRPRNLDDLICFQHRYKETDVLFTIGAERCSCGILTPYPRNVNATRSLTRVCVPRFQEQLNAFQGDVGGGA